jgi:cbb3-type cytochrome oxidase subunit 3
MSAAIIGFASGLTAAGLLAVFIGICVWTYSRSRRCVYEATSRLPLEEDDFRVAPPARDAS